MENLEVDQRTLARIFDCSPRTVRRWEGDGLAEAARVDDGNGAAPAYDLPAAVRWFVDRESGGGDDSADEYRRARARKMEADARLKELKAERQEWEFVPLHEAENFAEGAARDVQQSILSRAPRIATEIAAAIGADPAAVGPALEAELRKHLSRIADDYKDEEKDVHVLEAV